ncbi:MAG: HTH domain-containing protein [Polyangia bacterium]|jgi:biotin operon repressor|nr:HTH domain-containing protein [Polyangia bacterium]
MARRKKIPSIDEALQIRFDQLQRTQDQKIQHMQEQLGDCGHRLLALERTVRKLRAEAELRQLHPGADFSGPRKRIPPEKAHNTILARLRKARGKFVTSRELGGPLGLGRATVAARVKELREEGHHIDSSPRKGYALKTRR